jgi:hypothetical protein
MFPEILVHAREGRFPGHMIVNKGIASRGRPGYSTDTFREREKVVAAGVSAGKFEVPVPAQARGPTCRPP